MVCIPTSSLTPTNTSLLPSVYNVFCMIITIICCNYQYRTRVANFFCINCPFQITEFLRGSMQVRKYSYSQFCCYVSLVNGNWLPCDWPIYERCLYNADVLIRVLSVTLFSEQFADIAPNGILIK